MSEIVDAHPAEAPGDDPFSDIPESIADYQGHYPPHLDYNPHTDRELREIMVEARIPKFIGERMLKLHMEAGAKPRTAAEAKLAAQKTDFELRRRHGDEAATRGLDEAAALFAGLPPDRQQRLLELMDGFSDDPWLVESLINLATARRAGGK